MSNPLIAPSQPLTQNQSRYAVVPQAYFSESQLAKMGRDPASGKLLGKKGVSIEEASVVLGGLDMEPTYSFYVGPECMEPGLQQELALRGKVLATAQMGVAAPRRRTAYAMNVAGAFYGGMTDWRNISRQSVEARCKQVVYTQGGTANCLGRLKKFYPGRVKPKFLHGVTRKEAEEAIVRCGMEIAVGTKPSSFSGEEGLVPVTVNPDADNGFPFGSKWSNELTHEPILSKAQDIRVSVERAYQTGGRSGVVKWLRDMEASPETLKFVALKGKCKADPYKTDRVADKQMRFYNAFPRQIMFNLMRVTQPMDTQAQHMRFGDSRFKSAIGMTLVRGGADELVRALDYSLQDDGVAYTHVGDDSWVAVDYEDGVLLFSVDCSSFDLTQRSEVTEEIHDAIYRELKVIDGAAASLWYAYARERVVVTVNAQTYRWKHGGPSGFPLQSKINDCLMDVYLRRLLAALSGRFAEGNMAVPSREDLGDLMASVGVRMGLIARLEDYLYVPGAASIREALVHSTFLYIGYHFYVEEEGDEKKVYVVADVARQLSQIQYPSSFWVDTEKLLGMEAVRLSGVLISFGRVPEPWRAAYDAARKEAARYLNIAMRKDGDGALSFLPDNAFVGVSGDDVKSLMGLLNALERDVDYLWGHGEQFEGEVTSILVPKVVEVSAALRRGQAVEPVKPPTHPPTMANLGRPPPTIRWGPPKMKRYQTVVQRLKGMRRQAGMVPWDDSSVSELDPDLWENELWVDEAAWLEGDGDSFIDSDADYQNDAVG